MTKSKNYFDLREEYNKEHLKIHDLNPNPFSEFDKWFKKAVSEKIKDPNAMCLATIDENRHLYQRQVLLKEVHDSGFVFYTNYNSNKAKQISNNPNVSINFFWREQARQIIICGTAKKVNKEMSENYFHNRPRESQLAAWASIQSTPLKNREEIEQRYKDLELKYKDIDIPLPEFWGGYIIEPIRFEFWQGSKMRLHDRFVYERDNNDWKITRLNP